MSSMDQSRLDTPKNGHAPLAAPFTPTADLGRAFAETLEQAGFRVESDAEMARRYKLDLVITRLQNVHAHVNLGVLLTTRKDDATLMGHFQTTARKNVVHKVLYIEIDPDVVETGGVHVAVSACLSFLFDRRQNHSRASGVRVHEDCTFQFFEIEESLRRVQRAPQEPVAAVGQKVGQEMVGRIIAYFTDKGFGFIETEKDQKFFFHIANVLDEELRNELPVYQPGEDIPVTFKFGGSDGKKYPKALDVLLDQSAYEDGDDDDYEADGDEADGNY